MYDPRYRIRDAGSNEIVGTIDMQEHEFEEYCKWAYSYHDGRLRCGLDVPINAFIARYPRAKLNAKTDKGYKIYVFLD